MTDRQTGQKHFTLRNELHGVWKAAAKLEHVNWPEEKEDIHTRIHKSPYSGMGNISQVFEDSFPMGIQIRIGHKCPFGYSKRWSLRGDLKF